MTLKTMAKIAVAWGCDITSNRLKGAEGISYAGLADREKHVTISVSSESLRE